jgi:hypothetical protein
MAHTKKHKKNSSKQRPKLSNKPLEDNPMKSHRRNKFPKPRPNNKKNKKSGTDDTKGILINTISRWDKDEKSSDIFTEYVITTRVLDDALTKKIVSPLAERVSLFARFSWKCTKMANPFTKVIIEMLESPMNVYLELEQGKLTKWFVVKESTIENAGYGLFAARDFNEKETVGIYLGQQFHKARKDVTYTIQTKEFGFVDGLSSVMNNRNYPRHMCLHMCNDPTLFLTKREQINEAKEKLNLLMFDDLMVVAKKPIREGDELFLHYKGSY